MKRISSIIVAIISSFVAHAQPFANPEQYMSYFAEDVLNKDIIEGKWDIYSKTTAYFQGQRQTQDGSFVLYIAKTSIPRVFNAYYQERKKMVYYAKIEKLGSDKTYVIYLKNGHGEVNKERFTMPDAYSFSFTRQEDYGYAGSVNITFRGDKVYPTYEQYTKAIEALAKINEAPKSWSGTGFALNSGYIITNQHVVENAEKIEVFRTDDNYSTGFPAHVIASEKQLDLAIIKVEDSSFSIPQVPYCIQASMIPVGEQVFTLGYPLTNTMGSEVKYTEGTISSKTGFKGDITAYQTSVPIQPGNSGGPLFDKDGNVVGIMCAVHDGAENASYAIKTSYLLNMIDVYLPESVVPNTNIVKNKSRSEQIEILSKSVFYIKCEQNR